MYSQQPAIWYEDFDNEMDEVTEEFAVVKLSKEIKSKIKGV